MITLKPPFRAENMEGLYNKVIKGQISKIPERFSSDLWEVVKMLIQVTPESRPNCGNNIIKYNKIFIFYYLINIKIKRPNSKSSFNSKES
jgi:hypothetical protein